VPINSAAFGGARAKRTGIATVNVPSEKMAAFLSEMKTVRLRKVGESNPAASRLSRSLEKTSELSRRASVDSRPNGGGLKLNPLLRRNGLALFNSLGNREDVVSTGEKRKRTDFGARDFLDDQRRLCDSPFCSFS
jgi:hypothetical protein